MIKGSEKAKAAGRKAAVTRALNKMRGRTGLMGKYSKEVVDKINEIDHAQKKGLKIKFFKAPLIHVENIDLNKLKDTEVYTFYTEGPTKIQYSPSYRVIKISPHTIILTKK